MTLAVAAKLPGRLQHFWDQPEVGAAAARPGRGLHCWVPAEAAATMACDQPQHSIVEFGNEIGGFGPK